MTEPAKINDKPEENQPAKKPEMDSQAAAWLVSKLNCPIPGLETHEDRNRFAACVNQLIAIANWKEEK